MGQDLGIVTLNHDLVRMPFKFFSKSTHTLAPNLRKDEKKAEDNEDNAAVKETDNYNLKKCDSKKVSDKIVWFYLILNISLFYFF